MKFRRFGPKCEAEREFRTILWPKLGFLLSLCFLLTLGSYVR